MEAPVDLADVLCRLGKADLLRGDEEREDPPPAGGQQGPQPATPERPCDAETRESASDRGAVPRDEAPKESDEVSVDEYMAQLMRRLRGETAQEADVPAGVSASPMPAPPKPVRRKPPAPAPERNGFAAMRELANVSARSAVDQHVRRRMRAMNRSKLTVAVVASLLGLLLLGLWTTYAPFALTLFAATTSFTVSLLWALQWAMVVGRAMVERNRLLRSGRSGARGDRPEEGAEPTGPDA